MNRGAGSPQVGAEADREKKPWERDEEGFVDLCSYPTGHDESFRAKCSF